MFWFCFFDVSISIFRDERCLLYLSFPKFLDKKGSKFPLRLQFLEVVTFEGCVLSGYANNSDILLLLSGGCYFQNFTIVKFKTFMDEI